MKKKFYSKYRKAILKAIKIEGKAEVYLYRFKNGLYEVDFRILRKDDIRSLGCLPTIGDWKYCARSSKGKEILGSVLAGTAKESYETA